jgi:hypothetical protein
VPLVDIRSTGTALNLGDDSVSGNIALGFNFTLFGQEFSSAWVSNNGIISFTNGNIWSYSSTPLSQLTNTYNYALFPYWTDLINQGTANPYFQLEPGTAIFGWYNAAEYFNGGRNSFEVQIWEQNSRFQFRYGSLNLNNLPFTIGYTGNIDNGEFTELLRHPGGAYSNGNFAFESDALSQCTIQPLYDPSCPGYAEALAQQIFEQQCLANPLSSPQCPSYATAFAAQCSANPLYSATCPGYAAAFFTQQCTINPLFDSTCAGYQTAYFAQQCSIDPLYDAGCDGYQQAYFAQQCTANSLYDISCPGYTDRVLEIVASSELPADAGGTGIQVRNTGQLINPAQVDYWGSSEIIMVATRLYGTGEVTAMDVNVEQTPEEKRRQEAFRSRLEQIEMARKKRNAGREKDDSDRENEALLAVMARVVGWEDYLKKNIADGQNYRQFEIYREQRTVDNQRALRGLTGASERLHQEMVDQQYRR